MNGKPNHPRKASILVVDDTPENLRLLSELLQKQGYNARPVPNGSLALKAAEHDPPDLILLDINMPGLNGYEVCRRLKQDKTLNGIPVLFISALEETLDKVRAFQVGGVDYITKPFHFEEVNARVETHLDLRRFQLQLEELVQQKIDEISASQMATIMALAKLAESRDDETGKHTERVQTYCRELAQHLRKNSRYKSWVSQDYINVLFHAVPLHDIGKVGIPDSILLKPGPLTDEEFETMKTHTLIGSSTLESVQTLYPNNAFVNVGIAIARSHHERWDGKGYPDGLEGEGIPLSARIMAVADAYDAIRSKRPYKNALPHERAVELISKDSNAHFDPHIIDAFLKIEDQFAAIHDSLYSE